MEAVMGRALLADEQVHHKNGNKLDNSPSNLELWSKSQHPSYRVEDLLDWARCILLQYTSESGDRRQ